MANSSSVLDTLLDVTAKHFDVERATLGMTTDFQTTLKVDEHDMEELRIDYENARGVVVFDSFEGAPDIGAVFNIVAKYS